MPFVNKFKILVCTACLMLVGQGFAAEDCLETATVWKDCVSAPEDTTIEGVSYKKITNVKELAWFAQNYADQTDPKNPIPYNAILKSDIDLAGKLWIPIAAGDGSKRYGGIFDGNGHVIKNMYINASELAQVDNKYAQNLGFVGTLGGGTIKNLILEDINIQASTNAGDILGRADSQISVGAFVGWMADKVTKNVVDNCVVASGTIRTTGNGQGVGGIVGNAKIGTISNCLSLVEIHTSGSQAFVGGIIGITKTNVTVSSCVYAGPGLVNTGTSGSVGGVVGNVYSGSVTATDSYFEGNLTYNGKAVDGVGKNCGKNCTVKDTTEKVQDTNVEKVTCILNDGEWDDDAKECSKTSGNWGVGETGLSLNGYGKDGYKIAFDANGGSFGGANVKNKFLQAGMAITSDEIGNPSRDYYSFVGWAFTQDATEPNNLGFVSQSDTVYAVWEKKIKVTFDANGGTFPDESVVKDVYITKGDPITVDGLGSLPVTYCEEYSVSNPSQCLSTVYFTGWKDNSENTIDFNNHDVLATVDVTYKAIWTNVITYSVTFHANNNTTVDIVVFVDQGTVTSRPDDPTMDGYDFVDWYDGDAVFNFSSKIESSKDLYAHWTPKKYNVTYVLSEGGKDSGDNPVNFTLGEGLLDLNPPTALDGYVFDQWFYDSDFKQKATAIDRDVVGDKTFYAKFSKIQYRIMYLADNQSQGAVTDQFKEHGTPFTLESAGFFTRKGYGDQIGWAIVANGAKVYEFGGTYEDDAPLTVYPAWGSPLVYTINYVCNGCTNDPNNRPDYTIETATFSVKFADLIPPEGYKMVGWYSAPDYKTKVEQIKKGSFGDTTLYAKLNKIYKITYVGTDKPYCDTLYTVDDAITLRNPADSAGYTFGGWFTNANFEGDVVTGIVKGSTGDTTFYAKWIPVPYTIAYNIDGEPAELTPNTYTAAEATELATPTRDGYEFDGWYTNAEFNGDKVTSIAAGTTGDTTFFAKWAAVEYTATYDVNGGSMDGDVSFTFTIESGELTLATPNAREGFTFDGWLDSKTVSVLTGTFPANSFGERTLIAQWTPVLSTITVTAKSQVFEYDANPHSAECEIAADNPWGYTLTATSAEQVTDVKDGEVSASCNVVIMDGDVDITDLFDGFIEYVPGTISVKAKVVNYGGIAVTTDEDGTTAEIDDEAKLQIDIPSDVTVDHVTFNRNFPLVKYSTVVLPFSIDTNKVHGADFYSVSMLKQNGKWVAGASEVKTSQLIANTPYLLFAREANLTFDGPVTFNTSEMHDSTTIHEAEGCSWTFKGTYTKHVWGEGDPELGKVYAFSAHDVSDDIKIGKFTKFGKDAWIRPMRAYLIYESLPSSDPEPNHAPAPMSASAFKSMSSMASIENSDVPEWIDVVIIGNEDEQTTPIARLNTQTGEVKMMNGWFDMKGRKLNGKPTVKGIYYNNGKRVIVK